ncbi:MAG TPA: phosphotransferase, partial [Mycobacterium sp.]|nr:phosphotransferase [Mycobacterium sp.]
MSVGFNFLEAPELPAPQVSEAQAEEILASHYGLRARATSLGSQQDKNFVVTGPDGDVAGVLKIANPAFNATEIEAQELAADRIAEAEPTLRIAVGVPNLAGQKCTAVTGLVDGTAYVRLLRYLPGGTLQDSGYLSPTAVAGLGEVAGRVSRALEGFSHPGLDRVLQWDLRYGADVVAELISHVADPVQRSRIEAVARDAWTRIASLADGLPRQAVHLDMTDANVVVSRSAGGSALPDGVIDFGDLSDTWAVSELAITVSSVLGHPGTEPTSILPAVRAFHALRPLRAVEVDAVWPLVVLRTAVLLVSGAQQAVLDPDNPYLTDQSGGERRMFELATSIPIDVMTEVIRADLGLAGDPRPVTAAAPIVDVDAASVVTLDLATTSDAYDFAFTDDGSLKPGIEDELATAAVQGGARLVVTQYGQARLSRTRRLSQESPDVVATGISLWPASSTPLAAPWDGEV